MAYLSFNDLINLSLDHDGDSIELDCSLTLHVDGIDFHAYTVSLANRDLLFYCNEGTVTYMIDLYGDTARSELFDWTLD